MLTLDERQLWRLRRRANGLDEPRLEGSVAAVVQRVCGLQAQDRSAAELALQPRSHGLSLQAVRAALDHERSLVRTWAMRGTIHLLAAEDVSWLLALLGPVFVQRGARRRRQLGLDEATCARATAAVRRHLAVEGALTRQELAQRLGGEGIPVEGQAIYHLLYRAALEGVVCFGADRDGEHTFVLLEEWIGPVVPSVERDEALGRLAWRYLRAYGPAAATDFAKWCGLGMRDARRGLEANRALLLEVRADGETLFLLQEQASWLDEPQGDVVSARLLPAYDSFLLAYRSREGVVPEPHARRVHPGGGVILPTVLIHAQSAATWHLHPPSEVEIAPFRMLSVEEEHAVVREVQALQRYVGP